MKIYLASDHAGYKLKEELKNYLQEKGYKFEDMGNLKYEQEDDYPDFVLPLAEKVTLDSQSLGIILGRSGNGEAIVANKIKGIRAALCLNEVMAKKAREDNWANILALGADFLDIEKAKKIVDVFLETPFSEKERHKRRVKKISSYEAA